ncbi:MAG: hypothetical protein J7K85_08890 [Anaerolineaceae bacterium]|nr:hypothetical protein [Anaerolineaceae bacterium]
MELPSCRKIAAAVPAAIVASPVEVKIRLGEVISPRCPRSCLHSRLI